MNHMHRSRRFALLMMLGLALWLAGGCASGGSYVFESTPVRPATVSVVDAMDNGTLWSFDVPPEHFLEVDIVHANDSGGNVSGRPASSLNWSLRPIDRGMTAQLTFQGQSDGGRVDLEGRPVRIEVDYHPAAPRSGARPVPDETEDLAAPETDVEAGGDIEAEGETADAPAPDNEMAPAPTDEPADPRQPAQPGPGQDASDPAQDEVEFEGEARPDAGDEPGAETDTEPDADADALDGAIDDR